MTAEEEWVLQECGFNQLTFEGRHVRTSVRELFTFPRKPKLVLASSTWDTSHVFVEVKGEGLGRTLTTGRWKQVVEEIQGKLGGEIVKELTELDSTLIAKTDCNRVVSVDRNARIVDMSNLEADQSTSVDWVYPIPSGAYVRFSNGKLYEAALNADLALEICKPILPGVPVQQVSCGSDHVLLLGNGRVWSCGLNHRGQLGLGELHTRTEPVIVEALDGIPFGDIACGNWHSLALSQFGDLYSWGWNADRQLGHSADTATVAIPTLVDVGERNFKHVSCGSRHSAAVSGCGLLFTWGWNGYQQLGHHDCPGPAQVATAPGVEVAWLHCAPWGTLFLTHHRPP